MELPKKVPEQVQKTINAILSECRKIIVGKTEVLDDLLIALMSNGHILLEGVPGVAKTTLGKTFADVLGLDFKRIQCSPDILPADIVGTHVFDPKAASFKLEKGPIFSNVLLIDEINRNTPKANGAILEAMQEGQVTIEGETLQLPYPFLVIATQSPIEFHGVFPLPEVLVDRFLLSLKVDYPSREEEVEITGRIYAIETGELKQVTNAAQLSSLSELVKEVYLAPQISSYIVDLVQRTRGRDEVSLGASPRASIALTKAARARALIKGRLYVIPDDVKYLAPRILRHRIILSNPVQSQDLSAESFVGDLLENVPIPSRRG